MSGAKESNAVELVIRILEEGFETLEQDVSVGDTIADGPCIRVRRTGGILTQIVIDNAQITLEAYDTTPGLAEGICVEAGGILRGAEGSEPVGVPLYEVRQVGGVNELPDPDSDRYRCISTFVTAFRAE